MPVVTPTVVGVRSPPSAAEAPGDPPVERPGILVHRVADRGWLVRDSSVPPGIRSLLGCIEERAGRFELMELGEGFRWTTFDSLAGAVAQLILDVPDPSARTGVDRFAWLA